jgi:membrane protease subunit (stomatin/prohibitin family)
MAIEKNPNETAYIGGKKHWTDVIKNTGSGELLVWRQTEEDFNTNSTLVVMPGEEAIFIYKGNIEQVFDSGTYKLSSDNYPFIGRIRNTFSSGISVFNCVVYFINKSSSMEILWGTSSPIQVRDPIIKIATSIRARGSYKIKIDDGGLFLTKLLGNNINYFHNDDLLKYFENEFQEHIKSIIAKAILNSNKEILGICAEQNILSENIQPVLQKLIASYGIKLLSFTISGIDIPENDPNRLKLENAFANKQVFNILGNDWSRQQSTEILHDLANNSSGGIASMGAGIGLGVAAGSVFGEMAQQIISQPKQGDSSIVSELLKANELLNQKIITQDEFDLIKKKLLGV